MLAEVTVVYLGLGQAYYAAERGPLPGPEPLVLMGGCGPKPSGSGCHSPGHCHFAEHRACGVRRASHSYRLRRIRLMHCNFASLLVAAFGALSIAQSDEVTFDSASADIQNQLEVAIAELAELRRSDCF